MSEQPDGASVIVVGQLGERRMIEGGHTSRRGTILATLVKGGSPEVPEGPIR